MSGEQEEAEWKEELTHCCAVFKTTASQIKTNNRVPVVYNAMTQRIAANVLGETHGDVT